MYPNTTGATTTNFVSRPQCPCYAACDENQPSSCFGRKKTFTQENAYPTSARTAYFTPTRPKTARSRLRLAFLIAPHLRTRALHSHCPPSGDIFDHQTAFTFNLIRLQTIITPSDYRKQLKNLSSLLESTQLDEWLTFKVDASDRLNTTSHEALVLMDSTLPPMVHDNHATPRRQQQLTYNSARSYIKIHLLIFKVLKYLLSNSIFQNVKSSARPVTRTSDE